MNRRQFLTGASAAAIATVLPAAPAQPFVAVDLAAPGSERTAFWFIESTPGASDFGQFYYRFIEPGEIIDPDWLERRDVHEWIRAYPADLPEDCDDAD